MKKMYKEYEQYFVRDDESNVIMIDAEILKHRKKIGTKAMWEMLSFFLGIKNYKTCSQCGYKGPAVDAHHVHGRKNSTETIDVCANCHREIHAGTRSL